MNYCLAESSIGFYQISKLACIPTILLLEKIFDVRNQTLSTGLVCSLIMIITGMCLVIQQEIIINIRGVCWAVLGVVTTSLAQIFFNPLQKELNLDPMQLLYHTSPWLVIGSAATLPYFEDINHLVSFSFDRYCIGMIALTCVISVLFNISNYQLLSTITPLSYTILSHVKTLFVILLGSYLYPVVTTSFMYIGIVLAFTGAVAYKWVVDHPSDEK
jgi:solute carrier family 35 protein E3